MLDKLILYYRVILTKVKKEDREKMGNIEKLEALKDAIYWTALRTSVQETLQLLDGVSAKLRILVLEETNVQERGVNNNE